MTDGLSLYWFDKLNPGQQYRACLRLSAAGMMEEEAVEEMFRIWGKELSKRMSKSAEDNKGGNLVFMTYHGDPDKCPSSQTKSD